MKETFLTDLMQTYLSLKKSGEIEKLEGGDKFWSKSGEELDKLGEDWLITEFSFDEDWKSWEMHPNGEEIVYLLSGAMDLILEKNENRETIELREKGLVVIPRQTWHTAKVLKPSKMLIITLGKETQIRQI